MNEAATDTYAFEAFPKLTRWRKSEVIVTEKIDGTNAQVFIAQDGTIKAGSRTRWITPESDNYGFAKWVQENAEELRKLGPGRHFGEWWGPGIQRGYGIPKRRFSLFNAVRWAEWRPACCDVVPLMYQGPLEGLNTGGLLDLLNDKGSFAAPGFMNPEGIVIYHVAAGVGFKKTLGGDGHKGAA